MRLRPSSPGRLLAALDVTDPEPLSPGHPLWRAPGVLITPHVAASTPVSAARLVAFVRAQAGRFAGGQQLQNVIAGTYRPAACRSWPVWTLFLNRSVTLGT